MSDVANKDPIWIRDSWERGKCQECGKVLESKARFYCDEHRPVPHRSKAPATPRARSARNAKQARENVTGTTSIRAVTADVTQAAGQPRRPNVDATAKVLGKLLVYLTIFIAMYLVRDDPDLATEEQKEGQVDLLQLHDEEARSIAHPIARALHPTKLWQKYGAAIIEHSDVLDAVAALYDYASGLARYQRQRQRAARARGNAPSNGQVWHPPTEYPQAEPANVYAEYQHPDSWGQIPDADMVARIRQQRAEQEGQAG